MKMIYIASPYTKGDTADNVRVQMDAFHQLAKAGFCSYAPLISHYQQIYRPLDYETWLSMDLEIVSRCDAVLRLPGDSSGADREVEHAHQCGKPVYFSIMRLLDSAR